MEACGWRRHRAPLPRVNGLIPLTVERLVCTLYVGRQRNVAQPRDRFGKTSLRRESQKAQTISPAVFHASFQFPIAETDAFTHGNLASGTNKGLPKIGFYLPHQQNFNG